MRDITAITQEEIKMFLDATVGSEYTISQIEYNEKTKEVTVGVVTQWGEGTEDDPVSEIEDEFIFGQSNLDEGNFPDNLALQYRQFLLARGFMDNPFIDTNLLYAAPDMYEALKDLIEVMAGEQEAEDELEKAWGKLGRAAIEKARRVLSKAEGRPD